MEVVCGRGGSTHELVRDDHAFVCLLEQFTCISLVVNYLWANQ